MDCFLPAFNYRPLGSAQYILALRDFTDPENPKDLNLGLWDQAIITMLDQEQGIKSYLEIEILKQRVGRSYIRVLS